MKIAEARKRMRRWLKDGFTHFKVYGDKSIHAITRELQALNEMRRNGAKETPIEFFPEAPILIKK